MLYDIDDIRTTSYEWTPEELQLATGNASETLLRHGLSLQSAYSTVKVYFLGHNVLVLFMFKRHTHIHIHSTCTRPGPGTYTGTERQRDRQTRAHTQTYICIHVYI